MNKILLLLLTVGSAWAQIGGDNGGGGSGSNLCTLSGTQTTGYVLTATDNNVGCSFQTVGGASVSADTIKNAWYIADGGSANAITGTTTTSFPGSYLVGQAVIVKMANSNSGATTININTLGNKSVTKNGATALASGNLVSGQAYLMIYDGTQFEVANFTILAADIPTLNQNTLGNAATATALAANPGNCSSNTLPRGIDASGVAEGCAKVDLTLDVTGVLPNANTTATSTNTPSAIITRDASGNFNAGAFNKITLTAPATGATLTLIDGKTLTVNNTIGLSGTDSSTLNIGAGGTLGSNAFTSTAYLALAGGTLTGNLLFSTDNTLDIGASGATRPRDMFLGRNLTIGGSLTTVGGFGLGATPPTVVCGTGGCLGLTEGTVPPTCAASAVDCLYADASHRLFASLNNGAYLALVQGPASSTSADIACWNATDGGLLSDCTPSILKLSTFSSANLATQLTDESGTGVVCFTISCSMTTPNIGAATATSLNGLTITTSNGALTIPNGVTLTGPSSSATVATIGLTNTFTGRQDASGAASTSPAKTGTSLPGTCIAGDVYFKTDATAGQNLYECQATNTWTQQLNSGGGGGGGTAGSTLFSTTGSTTVTATSATTLIGSVAGSVTVPVNTLVAGQFLEFVAQGYYSTPATPASLTIDLKIGGTTRITTGAVVQLASVTNGVWRFRCGVTTRTAGASGTQISNCMFEATGSTLTPGEAPLQTSSTWTIDTTATQAIDLQATWSTATGSPTITSTNVAAWIPGAPISYCGPIGSAGQLLTDDGAGRCTSNAALTYSAGILSYGTAGSVVGAAKFFNATSGSITLQPVTGALGTVTLSLPAATDTLMGKATTDTFTNKTFDTAGSGNLFYINGTAITAISGSGAVCLASGSACGGALTVLTNGGIQLPSATTTQVARDLTRTCNTCTTDVDLYTPAAGHQAWIAGCTVNVTGANGVNVNFEVKISGAYKVLTVATTVATVTTSGFNLGLVIDSTMTFAVHYNNSSSTTLATNCSVKDFVTPSSGPKVKTVVVSSFSSGNNTLYTVPAATTAFIIGGRNAAQGAEVAGNTNLQYMNNTAGTRTIQWNVVPSGGSVSATGNSVTPSLSISTSTESDRIFVGTLATGDFISLNTDANTAGQAAWVTIVEIS